MPTRPASPKSTISVVLIEDNRLVREGLASLINRTEDFEVVAQLEAHDANSLRHLQPQVVLLDIGLKVDDSVEVAASIRAEFPKAKVVVMDLVLVHEDLVDFINVGVAGFIMKDATLEDLVRTIRGVARGEKILPPQMMNTLFSQIAKEAVEREPAQAFEAVRMTPRERQAIDLIAEGLSNKEIAARLGIATHTVKSHVRNVMEKLALNTRLQIAAYAHREVAE